MLSSARKGYTAEHDREHGVEHLLSWAQDYAARGRHLDAAALVEAAREVLFWQSTAKSDYDLIEEQLREAGLSKTTSTAKPFRIEGMAPGTTIVAGLLPAYGAATPRLWFVSRLPGNAVPRVTSVDGERWTSLAIDPSTIRDVTPPAVTP